MIISDACILNIINDASKSVNDAFRSVIDDSRVTLQIVASLTDDSCSLYYKRITIVKDNVDW